ncbi:hypothetical protein BDN71DRAFT_1436042 [Pleurotus eryngii]|uniref:Uncharacterized protein n=1 Tax=Pleurotus eryngii TaxID=5323 RepID=A0A9P5ZJD6_PLEER|nr:hypothetical protein BDN71DRAFT_1436042 [Pleurotus eryngii]
MHPLSFHPYRRPDSASSPARTRIVHRRRKSPEPEGDNFNLNLTTEPTSGSVGPELRPSQTQEEDACSTDQHEHNDLCAVPNTLCTKLEDKLTCHVCLQIIKSPSVHTFCAECLDSSFRARMSSMLKEIDFFPPFAVPRTDDKGIELWNSLSGTSKSVPTVFLHPCPTCRAIIDKRPVENFFVQELVRYFRDTVQPLFGGPSYDDADSDDADSDSPDLFDGLFPRDQVDCM